MKVARPRAYALSVASTIGLLASLCTPAQAQQAAAAPAAADAQADNQQADIIVTGTAVRAQRRFDVSYAINSLSQSDVQQIAPKSFADLLGTVPGIQVEATGGEELALGLYVAEHHSVPIAVDDLGFVVDLIVDPRGAPEEGHLGVRLDADDTMFAQAVRPVR